MLDIHALASTKGTCMYSVSYVNLYGFIFPYKISGGGGGGGGRAEVGLGHLRSLSCGWGKLRWAGGRAGTG